MRSLRLRLAIVLLLLMTVSGAAFWVATRRSADLHRDQVAQSLHRTLAASLVAESPLLRDGVVDSEALEHVFHTLMVVNPSIEVYLLDDGGRVLRYSAPKGRVVQDRVDLAPVARFLSAGSELPILGDDPRHPGAPKIFSAAPIEGPLGLEGYLYVVLQSERYASAAAGAGGQALQGLALGGVAGLVFFGLGAALAIHLLLTRRLRGLAARVEAFRRSDFRAPPSDAPPSDRRGDELDRLDATFVQMAERIVQQVQALRETDEHRRQLVASVSHDLRTPLAALEGYLETLLLKDDDVTAGERRQYLSIARKSAARLSRLVDELFELAKLEATTAPPDREDFCVAELASDVVQKFQLRANEKQVDVRISLEDDARYARGEIGLIERVLENLIENALRHTPPGGAVTLSLERDEGAVRVGVEDTGVGIASTDLPHVFDRFYRAESARGSESGGAGLGLAIAHRVVALHESTLTVESEVGKGTRFAFDLPAAS